jgi:hypothetical protein
MMLPKRLDNIIAYRWPGLYTVLWTIQPSLVRNEPPNPRA